MRQNYNEFIIKRTITFTQVLNNKETQDAESCSRAEAHAEKLKKKTPIGKLDEQPTLHPAQEKEPLPAWPENKNPHTGEVGGPRGPEPTRYGDWERKGRVSDF
jgi:hypothetical protein